MSVGCAPMPIDTCQLHDSAIGGMETVANNYS